MALSWLLACVKLSAWAMLQPAAARPRPTIKASLVLTVTKPGDTDCKEAGRSPKKARPIHATPGCSACACILTVCCASCSCQVMAVEGRIALAPEGESGLTAYQRGAVHASRAQRRRTVPREFTGLQMGWTWCMAVDQELNTV